MFPFDGVIMTINHNYCLWVNEDKGDTLKQEPNFDNGERYISQNNSSLSNLFLFTRIIAMRYLKVMATL